MNLETPAGRTHVDCLRVMKLHMAEQGIEVHIQPYLRTEHRLHRWSKVMVCPHDELFLVEPTAEQLLSWGGVA